MVYLLKNEKYNYKKRVYRNVLCYKPSFSNNFISYALFLFNRIYSFVESSIISYDHKKVNGILEYEKLFVDL
jgi:hypothetical protein